MSSTKIVQICSDFFLSVPFNFFCVLIIKECEITIASFMLGNKRASHNKNRLALYVCCTGLCECCIGLYACCTWFVYGV